MRDAQPENQTPSEPPRLPWTRPRLERIGGLSEIILSGGGKVSIVGGDPGEGRKPSGQG